MATAAEHTIKINRRNLLPTAAAAITAPIVPSAGEAATATGTQPGPMTAEAPDQGFSRENARRLLENHKGNRLRQEFGLPRLSVAKGLRRMKAAEVAA
jgi:hypothetical protein